MDQRHSDLEALKQLKKDFKEKERLEKEISAIHNRINSQVQHEHYDTSKGITEPHYVDDYNKRLDLLTYDGMSSGGTVLKVISTIIIIALVIWSIVAINQNSAAIIEVLNKKTDVDSWFIIVMYIINVILGGTMIAVTYTVFRD